MATFTPDWSRGVTTMKMINSTSIMSTIGVTLISEFKSLPPLEPRSAFAAIAFSSEMFSAIFGERLLLHLTERS
jgi:hypothetical protein